MIKKYSLPKPPKKILVITMRHLGDVLLSTPLVSSLKQSFPQAKIDFLVFENTATILAGNPDINEVICIARRPTKTDTFQLLKKIFRKYDLAVVTQIGDRPSIYSIFASSVRIAQVPEIQAKDWWRRYFFKGWAEFDNVNTHTVLQLLKLMDVLGKNKTYALTPPASSPLSKQLPFTDYAIVHLCPLFPYKRWNLKGWREIINFLSTNDINIVLTGSPNAEELNYVDHLYEQLPLKIENLAGKTSLTQLSELIRHARLFIGPDTGATHLSSAIGIPTIAIFGPTNPVKWAPWPINYTIESNPFSKQGNQCVNNVYIVQGKGDCVPCYNEGCDKHRNSHSTCLDVLPASEVKEAITHILKNA